MSRERNNTCYFQNRFYVDELIKPNTLTKKLELGTEHIIEVTMNLDYCVGASGGNNYARYINIFNVCNGKYADNISLNNFVKMIGVNFIISNYE